MVAGFCEGRERRSVPNVHDRANDEQGPADAEWQSKKNGGESGIRTHGTHTGTTIFETVAFDHSAISPLGLHNILRFGAKDNPGAGIFRQNSA